MHRAVLRRMANISNWTRSSSKYWAEKTILNSSHKTFRYLEMPRASKYFNLMHKISMTEAASLSFKLSSRETKKTTTYKRLQQKWAKNKRRRNVRRWWKKLSKFTSLMKGRMIISCCALFASMNMDQKAKIRGLSCKVMIVSISFTMTVSRFGSNRKSWTRIVRCAKPNSAKSDILAIRRSRKKVI